MLLVAMGYNASSEGMVGSDWEINTNALAVSKGLYDELDNVNPTEPLNRDNAAQMLFNTCEAPMVEYKNGGVSIAPDGTISTNSGTATNMTDKNDDDVTLFTEKFDMEDEEGILVSVDYDEADGDAAATYTYTINTEENVDTSNDLLEFDSTEDGSYADLVGEKVKVLYKETNSKKEIFGIYSTSKKVVTGVLSDLGDNTNAADTVKIDGTKYNTSKKTDDLPVYVFSKGELKQGGASNDATVDGITATTSNTYNYGKPSAVKAVANSSSGKIDYLIVTPVVVKKVTSLNSSKITINGKSYDLEDDIITYDDIAKDDWVILTDGDYTVTGKAEAKETEKVSGTVDGVRTNGEVRIDGTWYKKGDNATAPKANDEVELVIVGEYYYSKDEISSGSTVDDLLFVTKAGRYASNMVNRVEAEVIFADGTIETVQISKVNDKNIPEKPANGSSDPDKATSTDRGTDYKSTSNTVVKGALYTYEVNNSGYYEIKCLEQDNNDLGFEKFESATATSSSKQFDPSANIPKVNSYQIDDEAVVFIYNDDDDPDVITGAELKNWDDTAKFGTDSYVLADKVSGIMTAKVVALYDSAKVKYGSSTGDEGYGYLVSEPYYTKDGDNYAVVDVWNGEELLEGVYVENFGDSKVTPTDKNIKDYIEKGDFVSFSYLNNDNLSKMQKIGAGLAMLGTTADKDGNTVLHVTDNTNAAFDLTINDDTKVIYVDTDAKEGVESGEFTQADEDEDNADKYVLNIWSDVNSASTSKTAKVVFVDNVNNEIKK